MKAYYLDFISRIHALSPRNILAAINLLEQGNTVPFISRYRKERTGNIDEIVLFEIEKHLNRYYDLEDRKGTILKSIEEQGALTDDLKSKIENELESAKLEDIYLPYKPKKRTKALIAKEKGLEPLALKILEQTNDNLDILARAFLSEQVPTTEDALSGARDIIAEIVNENAEVRNVLRQHFIKNAYIRSQVIKKKDASEEEIVEAEKYLDYYDFTELIKHCKPHRFMAMIRGKNEGVLRVYVEVKSEDMETMAGKRYLRAKNSSAEHVKTAIKDSCKRLLSPSLENETVKHYKELADIEAIRVFASNLQQLLMLPPAGEKRILAIDPGFRTGCKVVCLDEYGNLLHYETIYPHPPKAEIIASSRKVNTLVEAYEIELIAIGNGTASRETERFISSMRFRKEIKVFVVDESGASIYSASKIAREEFPEYDVTVRGAVSIGRRLSDPLAELIKIDPKSIGVGQYQHDVDQNMLKVELDQIVTSCVNRVGVNLNTASIQLLSYVSGLGPSTANNIVQFRKNNGAFQERNDLLKIPRLGNKAFEQCAGFLRIPNGKNPLDNSSVHPENYAVVEKMASNLGISVEKLINNSEEIGKIKFNEYISENCGEYTIKDILEELKKPGRDPRGKITSFQFDGNISSIDDINEGAVLEGIVTNITNFGAFVDIGIKKSGLVHVSELSNNYIANPAEVLKLHQKVKVKVLSVDKERSRIQLSMKNI